MISTALKIVCEAAIAAARIGGLLRLKSAPLFDGPNADCCRPSCKRRDH